MKYSTLRIISGAIIIVSIILSKSLVSRFLMTVFIIILAINSGRKFRILPNIILLITVSFANTLSPNGLVLFTIGSYPITQGALTIGANKALLLISFIYTSHYMMSSRPQIPGKLGALLSLQFYYFDCLTSKWHQIEKKTPLIGAIDQLLISIEEDAKNNPIEKTETRLANKNDFIYHIFHISVIILFLLIFSDKAKSMFTFIALLP